MSGGEDLILLDRVDFELAILTVCSAVGIVGLVSFFQVSIALSKEVADAIVEYAVAAREEQDGNLLRLIRTATKDIEEDRLKWQKLMHRLIWCDILLSSVGAFLCFVNLVRCVWWGHDPSGIIRVLSLVPLGLLFGLLIRFGLWTLGDLHGPGPLARISRFRIALARREWPSVRPAAKNSRGLLLASVRLPALLLHRLLGLRRVRQLHTTATLDELLEDGGRVVGIHVVLPSEEQLDRGDVAK